MNPNLELLESKIRNFLPSLMEVSEGCVIDGCNNSGRLNKDGTYLFVRGYCAKHYVRFMKYGDANKVKQVRGQDRGNDPIYHIYCGIKARCYNKNSKSYKRYGAKGIVMDVTWLGQTGYENFKFDMGDRPYECMVERKDNKGNYTPNNCEWANKYAQARNKSNRRTNTGVGYNKQIKRWVASISVQDRQVGLGCFLDEKDAIKMRELVEIKFDIYNAHNPLLFTAQEVDDFAQSLSFLSMGKSQRKRNSPTAKKVINLITREIHPTVKSCAESAGIKRTTLINQLKGRNKNKTNFIYL